MFQPFQAPQPTNSSLLINQSQKMHCSLQLTPSSGCDEVGLDYADIQLHASNSTSDMPFLELNESMAVRQMNESSDAMAITFDVPSCSNQTFLISLQNDIKIHKNNNKKKNLKLKICRKAESCAICQEKVLKKSIVFSLSCGHTFHRKCLSKWQKKSTNCPLCRKQFQ